MISNEEPCPTISFYERLGSDLDTTRERLDANWKVKSLLEVIPNRKFNAVLEVGCGSALVLRGISKVIGADKKIGCDLASSVLTAAKIEIPESILVRADAMCLPFKDSTIDLVILSDILEHVANPSLLLKEARRVAKHIAFKIPLEKCLMIKLQEILRRKRIYGLEHHQSGHLYAWNKRQALSILAAVGLKPLSYKLVEPPEEIRYYSTSRASNKSTFKTRVVTWLEKNTYKKMRGIYRFLYGSTLVAFAKVEKS